MTTSEADTGLWVRRFHPSPTSRRRLVCLPHAGGAASFYFPMSRALSPDIEVLAIQYPGRQDRLSEKCIDNIPELSRQIFTVLRPWLDEPVAIFGHSMGASVGFELARLIETELGTIPTHLFASGRRAPSVRRHETVHLLDDTGLLAHVRALNGTDAAVLDDEELVRVVLPAIRNDYRAAETYSYQPGPLLRCPITVFTGDNDPRTTIDEAKAWSTHTTGRFDLRVFSGGHFFLTQHQASIVRIISDELTP